MWDASCITKLGFQKYMAALYVFIRIHTPSHTPHMLTYIHTYTYYTHTDILVHTHRQVFQTLLIQSYFILAQVA